MQKYSPEVEALAAQQQIRNAELHEAEQAVGQHLKGHPLARLVVSAKKLIRREQEDAEAQIRARAEQAAEEESVCVSFLDRQAKLEALDVWPKSIADDFDAIALTLEDAASRQLEHHHNNFGDFKVSTADIHSMMLATHAREFKGAYLKAFERHRAVRQKSFDEFVEQNRSVLKKYQLI